MAFMKITTSTRKNKTYYYASIAESYRENGKVKHKTLKKIGGVTKEQAEALKLAFSDKIKDMIDFEELIFEKSVDYGAHFVIDQIVKKIKLIPKLKNVLKSSDTHITTETAIKYILFMVYHQMTNPGSKLSMYENAGNTAIAKLLEIDTDIDLQTMYRSLEVLEENFEQIEKVLLDIATEDYGEDKQKLFYDITSSYFEGHKLTIAQYGYSRDKRRDKTQIVIGLVTTEKGFPIKCDVHRGNTVDKTTVAEVVENLTNEYKIEKIIFVGDRGMLTASNVKEITRLDQKYVMAIPRRWTKKYLKDIDINPENMNKTNKKDLYSIEVNSDKLEGKDKLLLCLNTRKQKDDTDYRNAQIEKVFNDFEKLNKKLNNPRTRIKTKDDLIKKSAVIKKRRKEGKYFEFEIVKDTTNALGFSVQYEINEEKLKKDSRLDGTFVIQTNTTNLKSDEVLEVYKNLSQVENEFKIIKNDLGLRPMHHYKEQRVKGHVYLTVLSSFILNAIDFTLKENKVGLTAQKALTELDKIKLGSFKLPNGDKKTKLTEISEKQNKILRALKIKKIKQ